MKVAMISLGCPKNLVDGERMLYLMDQAGYEITVNPDESDVMILNTCAFIDEAKAEAVENLIELTNMKRDGLLKKLIVTGCLAQRHPDEIMDEFPEVDAVLGCGSYDEIVSAAAALTAKPEEKVRRFGDINAPLTECGRIPATPFYSSYVKIAEGCDNRCAYCVIPELRGKFRSRKREDILAECRALAEGGSKEIIVVAQDISRYGLDIYGKRSLAELARDICAIDGVEWVRLHYLYPDGITDELIETMQNEKKICRYLDIPIQHINNRILKAMNRRGTGDEIRALIKKLRKELPGVVLRTSIIAGLPGEGEKEFSELAEFLREARIERAGVFAFSPQDGTAAAEMPGQVDEGEREHRRDILMEQQQHIMDEYAQSLVGTETTVLCEGFDKYAEICYGRTFADSPDIDGKIFIKAAENIPAGEMVRIRITELEDGELFGERI